MGPHALALNVLAPDLGGILGIPATIFRLLSSSAT